MALTVKLTPGQRSAVEIYVTDPAHAEDFPEASLHGAVLRFDSTADRAAEILIEASNSADVGDGRTPDRGAVKAISNVLDKLRKQRGCGMLTRRCNDWDAWWSRLGLDDRRVVRRWLSKNPPPPYWQESKIAYAFTEMPFAPRGAR